MTALEDGERFGEGAGDGVRVAVERKQVARLHPFGGRKVGADQRAPRMGRIEAASQRHPGHAREHRAGRVGQPENECRRAESRTSFGTELIRQDHLRDDGPDAGQPVDFTQRAGDALRRASAIALALLGKGKDDSVVEQRRARDDRLQALCETADDDERDDADRDARDRENDPRGAPPEVAPNVHLR